jgi:signal transduction histidine kinase/ActR/RegA family two-component response regulator
VVRAHGPGDGTAFEPLIGHLTALARADDVVEVVDIAATAAADLTGADHVEVSLTVDGAEHRRDLVVRGQVPTAWLDITRGRATGARSTLRATRDRLLAMLTGAGFSVELDQVPSDWLAAPVLSAGSRDAIGTVQAFSFGARRITARAGASLEAFLTAVPLALGRVHPDLADEPTSGGAHVGRWWSDPAACTVRFDAAAARLAGLEDPRLRSFADVLRLLEPTEIPRLRGLAKRALSAGGDYEVTCRVQGDDGVVRWLRLEVSPDGDRLRGTVRDVTEQTRLRAELAEAQRLHGLGHLAAGVVHDLNNWLTVIIGHAELLHEQHALSGLGSILSAADQAGRLTARLLRFSSGPGTSPTSVDANEVVLDLEPLVAAVLSEGVSLELDLTVEPLPLWVDQTHLAQVLLNLILNARDAVGQRGRVTIRTCLVDGTGGTGSAVELSVADDGIGMDAETLARCSEPFFTSKVAGSGTGLGLSTCRSLVEGSGGSLHVASEVGVGTTVTVRLPVRVAQDAPEDPSPPARSVLLVEDEPGLLEILRRVLERAGHVVLPAADVEAAVACLRTRGASVGVVVADLVLPDGSATDVFAAAERFAAGAGRVLMSGHTDVADEALADGAVFLAKPFRGQEVLAAVEALLPLAGSAAVPAAGPTSGRSA